MYLIGGSIPERENELIYNTSLVFSPDGQLLSKFRKIHLFDIDVPGKMTFKESETLSPGDQLCTFDVDEVKVGLAICYDLRFPKLSMKMRELGCHFLCFPGAFNMTTGPAHWNLLLRGRAVDNQLYVAGISPSRNVEADYVAFGHSTVVSPWGDVEAEAAESEAIIYATIDLERVQQVRQQIPTSIQQRDDVYHMK